MYFVKNKEQSGSDDWQIANVVDWRRQRLGCSSRPGTSVLYFEDTGGLENGFETKSCGLGLSLGHEELGLVLVSHSWSWQSVADVGAVHPILVFFVITS